jgi:hypothetical protein
LFLSVVAGWALLGVAIVTHGNVVGTYTDNNDGTVTYFYKVDNRFGLQDVAMFSLEFAFAAPDWNTDDEPAGGDVKVPNDWFASLGIPIGGLSAQDFAGFVPGAEVTMGAILSGFSFTSSFRPGMVNWFEFPASGGLAAAGTTIGPAASHSLPESNLWAEGIALTALLAFGAIGRRVPRVACTNRNPA